MHVCTKVVTGPFWFQFLGEPSKGLETQTGEIMSFGWTKEGKVKLSVTH